MALFGDNAGSFTSGVGTKRTSTSALDTVFASGFFGGGGDTGLVAVRGSVSPGLPFRFGGSDEVFILPFTAPTNEAFFEAIKPVKTCVSLL